MYDEGCSTEELRSLPLPPSYQEAAQGIEIPENRIIELQELCKGFWSQGYGTITIHNHPRIPPSYLNAELKEGLEISYDLSGLTIPFENFVDQQLLLSRKIPSEADLETTRRLSNTGIGMIAIGAGGLDVAVAMGGGPFYLATPKVVFVELKGKLRPGISAKDIILEVLRIVSVKGGVGKIFEYGGDGVKTLTVP